MRHSRVAAGWFGSVALALVLLAGTCKDVGRPLSEEQLVSVVVDLHLLEARRELVSDAHPHLRDSILAVHGITHDRLEAAIEYYAERPDEYVSLYNQVIDSLSAEEAQLEEAGVIGVLPPP